MSAPDNFFMYNNQYLIAGGGIFNSASEANGPRGALMVFDINNFAGGPVSSVKLSWSPKYYVDVTYYSEPCYKVMDLSMSGNNIITYTSGGLGFGRVADGEHPIVLKFQIANDGTLTNTDTLTWNAGTKDVCDTATIVGSKFYISCGLMEYLASSNKLPFVA